MKKDYYKVVVKHNTDNGKMFMVYEDKKDNFSMGPVNLNGLTYDDEVILYDRDDEVRVIPYEKIDEALGQPGYIPIEIGKEECMEMHFEDVTEEDLFNFDPIKEGDLNNKEQGLWAYHGLRKFKFTFTNIFRSLSQADDVTCTATVVFNRKDNDAITEIRMEDIKVKKDATMPYKEFFAYIDTNRLGDEFDHEKQRLEFSGAFEMTYEWKSKEGYVERYAFPIRIILHNTNYVAQKNVCMPLELKAVSIDFGTSSSCVAVRDGKEISLLTLSNKEESDDNNQFENPTNVMIFRWEELYNQWKNDNNSLPYLLKGTREQEKDREKAIEFDIGYTVKDVLQDAQTAELNSVLTQIKLIPYNLQKGEQIELNPFIKKNISVVKLVSSPEEQDIEHFDPIAFYGYLLGRAINRPSEGKIYTKFDVTYPVKFNTEVREKARKSLEYGLKRSLPLPLRGAVDKKGRSIVSVNMKYAEPVAYIGSVCGKYLKIESDNRPQLFAVYDFGGGTLDYSFGMFRPTEDGEYAIDIYSVDGDETIGGESLISLISFWIYTSESNKQEMINNSIPFELLRNEKRPDDFPDKLMSKSGLAKSNLRKLNETFSRLLFENRVTGNIANEEVELFDENGQSITINIAVDYDYLKDKLDQILQKTIDNFYCAMKNTLQFNQSTIAKYGNFTLEDFNIFKAGNSSKNIIVEQRMAERFPENRIELIDEVKDDGENKRYAITPKTAVAFGQLRLNEFEVNILEGSGDAPFKWYVGTVNKGNGEFIPKINKNEASKEWIKQAIIRASDINIYYSGTPVRNADDLFTEVIYVDEDDIGCELYIRTFNDTSIEYCIVEKGEMPDVNIEPNEENVIILK